MPNQTLEMLQIKRIIQKTINDYAFSAVEYFKNNIDEKRKNSFKGYPAFNDFENLKGAAEHFPLNFKYALEDLALFKFPDTSPVREGPEYEIIVGQESTSPATYRKLLRQADRELLKQAIADMMESLRPGVTMVTKNNNFIKKEELIAIILFDDDYKNFLPMIEEVNPFKTASNGSSNGGGCCSGPPYCGASSNEDCEGLGLLCESLRCILTPCALCQPLGQLCEPLCQCISAPLALFACCPS